MKKFANEAKGYVKDMFNKNSMVKRGVISFISVVLIGLGIALLSLSGFGVNPFTSMNMNLASAVGMRYGDFQLLINIFILLFVLIVAHRGLIGIGTLFNMVGCGYACEFFEYVFEPMIDTENMAVRIALLALGTVMLAFSSSLFYTAEAGVGPYDAIGFMICRGTGLSYKKVRVITDISVVLIGVLANGGIEAVTTLDISKIENVGIATIITAFFTGPLINAFDKNVSNKILEVKYEKVGKSLLYNMIKASMVKANAEAAYDQVALQVPEDVDYKEATNPTHVA